MNYFKIKKISTMNYFIVLGIFSLCQGLPENYGNSIENDDRIQTFRPVVLIQGLLGNPNSLENVRQLIEKEHPGTQVYNPRLFLDTSSFNSLWEQVETLYQSIKSRMNDTDGINIVAYSQGGLVARGIIEIFGLKVHNFVSLSSPQAGQYGEIDLMVELLRFDIQFPILPKYYMTPFHLYQGVNFDYGLFYFNLEKEEAFKKFYLDEFFRDFSVPQYWNDPHNRDMYLKYCKFLPVINNEIKYKSKMYADNFKKLNKLVLIGGPDDEVVTPWQSSYFSFYDANETVVDFREMETYKKDLFGLRTLDEQNKIQIYIKEGIGHHDWYLDDYVLKNFVLPWLD